MTSTKNKKVYVGISGGVDSSVSAYLLKKEGYDVTGVFIRVWYPPFVECDWKSERRSAMKVCAHLGIPFKELNLEEVYKDEVVDYMVEEYKSGRTPNPDVMCNRHVKFGAFLKWALSKGADFIATGHYARINKVRDQKSKVENFELLAGIDRLKDQSYFLWTLTQEQLAHILFPVGDLQKSEVRKIAEDAELHTATKKDSQGLCFVGAIDMKEFLKKFIETREGAVLDESGVQIGVHEGSELYTIGERHGFLISPEYKDPNDTPRYVISKNVAANTVTVSMNHPQEKGEVKVLHLNSINWITNTPPEEKEYQCRIRYRQDLIPCRLKKTEDGWDVEYLEPQPIMPLGQSCVVYDGDVCVGGGIIDKVN